jgi:hypothetical protein
MATKNPVNPGSRFCRHCGKTITLRGGLAWCENVNPEPVCPNLTREDRLYCEHEGCADAGPGVCPNCGKAPLIP